jgi:hypothetical protein
MSKVSVLRNKEISQMRRVLQVSTVDLWAAEAYLVMATPVALKQEIEQMMPKDYQIRTGFSPICLNAIFESSR